MEIKADEKAIGLARLERVQPAIAALLRFAEKRRFGTVMVMFENGHVKYVDQNKRTKVD